MWNIRRWAAVLACGLAGWASAAATSLGPKSPGPAGERAVEAGAGSRELVFKIHAIDELEMRIGQVAVRKGQDARVRRYGRVLWRDHRNADARLLSLARRLELDVSGVKPDPQDAATLDKLEAATGADFDRSLAAAMHEGHQKAISLLESARESQSPALRDLVGKLLPILRQHDQLALELRSPEGGRHG